MYARKVLTITEALAQIIGEAHDQSDLKWEEIAKASGLSSITVKRIAGRSGRARAQSAPTIEQIAALARAFGADAHVWIAEAERRVKASNADR